MNTIRVISNDVNQLEAEFESADRKLRFAYFSLIAEMQKMIRHNLLFHVIQKRLEAIEKGSSTFEDVKESFSQNMRDYFNEQSITVEKVEETYGTGKCWNIIFSISGNKCVLGNSFALRVPDIKYHRFNPVTALSENTSTFSCIVQELPPKLYRFSSNGVTSSYIFLCDYFDDIAKFTSYFTTDQY